MPGSAREMDSPAMDLREIACLEEARLARVSEELCDECLRIGGGIAGRGAPGSWLNLAVGIGLEGCGEGRAEGPGMRAELERMIAWYAEKGIEPRMEVCPFVTPEFLESCEALAFRARAFETVFARVLGPAEEVQPPSPLTIPPGSPGIVIERLDPADDDAARESAQVALRGFLPPGGTIQEEDIAIFRRSLDHPCTTTFVAREAGGGRGIVAVGACEVRGEVAAIFGMSTLEAWRRRGIQQALLAKRITYAASQGARIATIGSRPGVATERNVMRMGFRVAYTKVVMVRPGPGLMPMRF